MRIAGIDFPEPLLSALRDNRLVIFAGAGVSMGEPPRLPNFEDLTRQIAHGTGEERTDDEPPDRFLGRLQDSGVEVHDRAGQLLSRDNLVPAPIHRDLLRCFGIDHVVRVVTTNFDSLFEDAADQVLGSEFENYSAPALPIGSGFGGLVHVHGSLHSAESMVLTDEDFGRAYLTEGWARRFLLDLFRSFSVLFVGYSHSDVVMSYLARALPPPDISRADAPRRFALTDMADDSRWRLLGITPVSYPKDAPDDHSCLDRGIAGLAAHMQQDLLGWQQTIEDIARGSPPLDPERQDLIDDALTDPARVRFFTRAATDPAWIDWLHNRGHLAGVFDPAPSRAAGEIHASFAWWLCKRFARKCSDKLLRAFGRHGMRMGPEMWRALAVELVAEDEEKGELPEWDPSVVAKWISVLLDNAPPDLLALDAHLLSLAKAADRADLSDSLMGVFDAIAVLSESARNPYVDPDWGLNDVWEKYLAPRIQLVAEPLLSIVLARLQRRHQWACVWENATRETGLATVRRERIEAREEDSIHHDSNDVLIDVGRECLLYLMSNDAPVAAGYLDQMVRAEAPLLRRIAIHCGALRDDLSAGEKTEWLLRSSINLYDRACQRELLRFTEATFAGLSETGRLAVLEAVDDYPFHPDDTELPDD